MVNVVGNDELYGGGTKRRVQVIGLLLAVLSEPCRHQLWVGKAGSRKWPCEA